MQDIINSYEFQERAAIREYDGNMPREEAERLTRIDFGLETEPEAEQGELF